MVWFVLVCFLFPPLKSMYGGEFDCTFFHMGAAHLSHQMNITFNTVEHIAVFLFK